MWCALSLGLQNQKTTKPNAFGGILLFFVRQVPFCICADAELLVIVIAQNPLYSAW